MRKKRFALVCLIMLAMVSGYAARLYVDRNDPIARIQRDEAFSRFSSAAAPSSAQSDIGTRSDIDLSPIQVFYQILVRLREDYVEPIPKSRERELTYSALSYMLDSLNDPQTRFYTTEQAKLAKEAREGKFYGIGAIIAVKLEKQGDITEERLVVTGALPGSPAEKAGLLSGDVITRLDGKTVLPYKPLQRVEALVKLLRNGKISDQEFRKKLEAENERLKDGVGFHKVMDMLASGKDAKSYTLTVERPGATKPLEIKVGVSETKVDPVTSRLINPSIGYIDLNLIVKPAEAEFSEAVAGFKKQGVRKLVIDLRNSPGGALESAQAIAGNLIPNRTLAILQLPKGKQKTLKASPAPASGQWIGELAVLVDSGTTGLSEVLAAALRDGKGAKLVGSSTFGSNLQQTVHPLADASAVSMTTGKYLTPKGVDYKYKGLSVDAAVPAAGTKADADAALNKAVELLNSGKVQR